MSFGGALLWGLFVLFTQRTKCDESTPLVKECHPIVTAYMDPQFHWDRLKLRYDGCTHVMGDLVITALEDPSIDYDLSFLENVTYVKGFVGIYANHYPKVVKLPKLQIIRGKTTFKARDYEAALVIAANDHEQIYLPSLKEISEGDVYVDLKSSKRLCFLDTIEWLSLVRNGTIYLPRKSNTKCPACSSECSVIGWGRRCWGPRINQCQWPEEAQGTNCSNTCGNGCPVTQPEVCCDVECAIGCTGPTALDCLACRNYKMWDGVCVSECPFNPPSSPHGQDCIPG